MGNEVGRTGFHAKHEKSVKNRGAILDEMMRELDPESSERWAERNPNIVLDDEGLNRAYVNNGDGHLVPCKDPKEVLAYGQQRLAKLSTPAKEPKLDPVTGKERGGTTTSSMFVLHLPKSLCEEVKDFYPVLDDDGHETGQRRSRWVARDPKEAMRYFSDALRYMAQEVIPGGVDAVLGVDIQFSESTPHVHILADTFAPDPKHPGQLRSEFSRAYGSHRSVRDDKGRQMSGQAKFRRYHDGLKQYMIERGWPVERDVDPLRHDKTATKDMYGAMLDKQRTLDEYEQDLAIERRRIDEARDHLDSQWKDLDITHAELKRKREQLQEDEQKLLEEARMRGYAKGLAEGRAQVDALRKQALQQLDDARALLDAAAKQNEPLPLTQTRETFRVATGMFADRLIEKGIQSDIVRGAKEWVDRSVKSDSFAIFMETVERSHNQKVRQRQRLRQNIIASARQLDGSVPYFDDGMGF